MAIQGEAVVLFTVFRGRKNTDLQLRETGTLTRRI